MTLAQTTLLQSVTNANVTFIDHFPLFGAERVGDLFTAYVPGEVTQVSRMTDLHPKFLEKSPR